MITRVDIVDFLSHRDTTLKFDPGVNVITGPNGAGKSSVVDAITFALFSEHMRRDNKSLMRHGASSCMTSVEFTVGNRRFDATRKIRGAGTTALLREKRDDKWCDIASGERRQMDESTSSEIEKIMGMDFEKLQIASIVRQGELAAIVHDTPKGFKTRINDIIGIDKLDEASERMGDLLGGFRRHVRGELGHDDTHLPTLRSELEQKTRDLQEAKTRASALAKEKAELAGAVARLEAEIEAAKDAARSKEAWDKRMGELLQYVEAKRKESRSACAELEAAAAECRSALESRDKGSEIAEGLAAERKKLEESKSRLQSSREDLASLSERLDMSGKLVLKDGRCPLCDSEVSHLNPVFAKEHLISEISKTKSAIAACDNSVAESLRKISDMERISLKAIESEGILRAHSVGAPADVERIEAEAGKHRDVCEMAEACIGGDWRRAGPISEQAGGHCRELALLEPRLTGADTSRIEAAGAELGDAERRLEEVTSSYGAAESRASTLEAEIGDGGRLLAGLETAHRYALRLEMMRGVFSRDGVVATSMRSWALSTISESCTKYLATLDTKINRITLAEQSGKRRSVVLTCHVGNDTFEIDSLSGGEQVCVALALRLGMAGLLGSRGPSFVILDEPTAHLDAERRKSLAHMLAGLTNSAESPMQLIIITHDMEIFEEAPVERRYEFELGANGTECRDS